MLSAMLLGLLTVGAVARQPDPPVRIWLDRKDAGYWRGDQVKVFLKTRDDRYIVVFQVDPDNRLRVLFPLDPRDDNYVKGGKTYKLMNRGGREGFQAEVAGRGVVFAAASSAPFKFDGFMRDGYWDYGALNATPIEGDVEQALVDLMQRMAAGPYDYDILEYGAYADASEIAPGTDLAYEVEPTLGGCLDCLPVSTVVVGPGGAGYCSTPLYDPLCYDPLYWSPGYVPPNFWNAGWGWYGGYVGGAYGGVYVGYYPPSWYVPGYGGGYYPRVPVGPYQAKPWERKWSGESQAYAQRVATENVNTVVGPLPSTGRILKADPRRTWGGAVPPVIPAAPVPGAGVRPGAAPPRGRGDGPTTYAPSGQDKKGDNKPAQPLPPQGPKRTWSDGKSGQGAQPQAAPPPKSSSGGGGSKPSQPSSGSGGRGKG